MRWKSMALAGAFAPAIAGCQIASNATHNLVGEHLVVGTQSGIERELARAARAAWAEVRQQYPRRTFSAEFHDGFLDGYVDYLDRGGNGTLPAVPPVKYTRHKKYFTEEGQCLVKDYFLGFKYGQDIAISFGDRSFLTVPVLLPETPPKPPAFYLQTSGTSIPPDSLIPPTGGTSGGPPLTAPSLTEILPKPKPLPRGSDGPPLSKPLPIPSTPPGHGTPLAPTGTVTGAILPSIPTAPTLKLPPPPPEVPTLPAFVPTPSAMSELPVIPPNHLFPEPLPPNHPEPSGK